MNHDRDDGETMLKPEGCFNGLNTRDQTANALDANALNPTHDNFKALPEDEQEWVKSRVKFLGGNKIVLKFKPYLEVFHLNKLLVPGVLMQIQMYLNSSDVWSMKHGGVRHIRSLTQEDISVKLHLCQKKSGIFCLQGNNDSVHRTEKVTYPTVRSEIRTFNHANDNQLFECHNPFHNQLPNRVIVALLEQTAFNGDNRKYPFSYKTFNITSIKQLVRGKEYPYTTLELDHNNVSKDFRGHHRFLQATESLCKRKGNMVRADDWGEARIVHCLYLTTRPTDV